MKVLAYYRVSTQEQGKSGLGLEAQRETVRSFCKLHNLEIIDEITEIGSGGSLVGRPLMQALIKQSKKLKSPIVVAKGDRAFRKETDRLNAKESGLQVINVQLGMNPDETLEGVHGLFSEMERKVIKARTSAALQQKVKQVGWWGYGTAQQARGNGHKTQSQIADDFAQKMKPTIELYRNAGKSFNQIAKLLNDIGAKTRSGKEWSAKQVINLANRVGIA